MRGNIYGKNYFYTNSFLANVVNIPGYFLMFAGVIMLFAGFSEFIISIILIGIVLIAAGLGCSVLSANISERKRNK